MIAGMVSKKNSRPWAKTTRCGLAFVICLFGAAPLLLRAAKLAEFREPFSYPAFAIDKDRVYIWDRYCVVHIYARKDFAHIGQFGRKGQGPSDFLSIEYIHILPDRLCIGQGQKISYFSKEGEFLKAITNPNPTTGAYTPLGSNYVGTRYLPSDPEDKLIVKAVTLYDSRFEPIKELFRAESHAIESYNYEKGHKELLAVPDCFGYEVCDDRLYVGNTGEGFFFRVFNSRGEKLYDISRDYERRTISSGDIKKIMAGLREAVGEQKYNTTKDLIIFPKFFPAYSDFSVADGKLYVFSYTVPDRPIVATTLDLRGNLLREVEIAGRQLQHAFVSKAYRVYKNRYYYMVYNEESDKWELHVENLE